MSFKSSKKATSISAPTRHVHVAHAVHDHWHREGRHRFELGFLVGQSDLLATQDVVLAAVEVPSEAPDLDHDVEVVQGFEDLSVDWVQEIALQIHRLLPGGVEIMGLYVVAAADARSAIDQASVYLRAIVAALALPTEFQQQAEEPEHHCIVHICSKTSIKSVQSFADLRDVPRTATVAAQLTSPSSSERLEMKKFTTSVAIDEVVKFTQLAANGTSSHEATLEIAEKRLDELHQQLQPLAQRIWRARGVAAGGATNNERIELLTTTSVNLVEDVSAVAKASSSNSGRCRGVVQCVAFVPTSEPRAVELATFYLKRDFVKSLFVRVELLAERVADEDTAGDACVLRDGGLLKLPKRGLMNWRSGATPSTAAIQLSVHALTEDDDGSTVQNALEILSAGDELPGVEIDAVIASLEWLESDADSDVSDTTTATAGRNGAGRGSAPGVVVSSSLEVSHVAAAKLQQSKHKSGEGNSTMYIVLSIVLLLLALVLAQQLK